MKPTPPGKRKPSLWKAVLLTFILLGIVFMICLSLLIYFADHLLDAFLRDRMTNAFAAAYPSYSLRIGGIHSSVWKSYIRCDSLTLETVDSTIVCSATSLSVNGIDWMKILQRKALTRDVFESSEIDVQDVLVDFRHSQNELSFKTLHLSLPDSEMVIDSVKYYSVLNDEHFFSRSRFRQTRYRFTVPRIGISGLNSYTVLDGDTFRAESIDIQDAIADVLVNMDKPYDKRSTRPQMPNEALLSLKKTIKIDSVIVRNGQLKYCERYAVRRSPGVITFNKIHAKACGIANHTLRPDTAFVHGEGLFMNAGVLKVFLAIPLASPGFSLRYSGTLGEMRAEKINQFLELAEHRRIASGILQSATCQVNVVSGKAHGTLRAVYKDLSISLLDKKTGKEGGILNRIASFLGNLFVVRGTNVPDKNGELKVGKILYSRKPDDYFFQFLWFSVRTGVSDVVGMPLK
jgi:hypothetical protein